MYDKIACDQTRQSEATTPEFSLMETRVLKASSLSDDSKRDIEHGVGHETKVDREAGNGTKIRDQTSGSALKTRTCARSDKGRISLKK